MIHARSTILRRAVPLALVAVTATAAVAFGAAGQLDPTFGTGGKTVVTLWSGNDHAMDSAVQSDGKLVVVGSRADNGHLTVLRFTETGIPDPAFGGGDGITEVAVGTSAIGNGVVLQSDGKIVVGGTASGMGLSGDDLLAVRLNTDGTPDNGFDSDGVATIDFGGNDDGQAVALDDSGNIVVAGTYNGLSGPAVARLSGTNGALDTTFDTDGKTTLSGWPGNVTNGFKITGIFIQNNHKIVLSGTNGGKLSVARIGSDGSRDSSFGFQQLTIPGATSTGDAGVASSGGVVTIAGTADFGGPTDLVVARFDNSGSLDNTFSGDGWTTTDSGATTDAASDAYLLSDGAVIVSGGDGNNTLMVQYRNDGSLETNFGAGGIATVDLSGTGTVDRTNGIAVQPNGKIVLAAEVTSVGTNLDPAVARLQGLVADLTVTIADAPDPAQTGKPVTWTATVSNTGTTPQTGVSATFTIPAGLTVTSLTSTAGTCTTSPATCTIGTIAGPGTATLTLVGTPTLKGTLSVPVTVSGNSSDVDTTNNTATATTNVRQTMALSLAETTAKGKVRKCGKTLKKLCTDKAGAKKFFAGALTPAASATKGQVVTLKFYRKKGKKFVLAKTFKTKLNAKKRYVYVNGPGKLPTGTWRVQSSVAATATTTAATSTLRYLKVV